MKKLSAVLHKKQPIIRVIYIVWIASVPLEWKTNSNVIKRYVKRKFSVESKSHLEKILKFKQCMRFEKMPCIFYTDVECLIKKIDRCKNNPKYSSRTKIDKHTPCGYSLSTIWGFDHIKNKHSFYRGKTVWRVLQVFKRMHKKHNRF